MENTKLSIIKLNIMKNVSVKFTVKGSNNYYFATSHKAKVAFVKKEGFEIDRDFDINTLSVSDRNLAEKIDRGIWYINGARNLIY